MGRKGKQIERVKQAPGKNCSGGWVRDMTDFLCPGLSSAGLPLPVVKRKQEREREQVKKKDGGGKWPPQEARDIGVRERNRRGEDNTLGWSELLKCGPSVPSDPAPCHERTYLSSGVHFSNPRGW